MKTTERIGFGASLLVLLALGACGGPCEDSEDRVVPLSELPCSGIAPDGVWESHPWPPIDDEQCEWFEFRGCSQYEIEHPLGEVPSVVIGYLSFDPDGSFATVGSGNSFIVEETTDQAVRIRNAQNQVFFLRLVLW